MGIHARSHTNRTAQAIFFFPQAAVLLRSNAGSDDVKPALNIVSQNCQIRACQNKLLLNYPKTNFMVIEKYIHKSVSASFDLDFK